jgi:hypothetical protein
MADTRDVTITFEDGTNHVYRGVPTSVTPDQIEQRASSEFSGKKLSGIAGGVAPEHQSTFDAIIKGIEEAPTTPGTRVIGPAIVGGAGELVKGLGAATELAFPDTGKKIERVGQALKTAAEKQSYVPAVAGEVGSYVAPFGAATKAVGAVKGIAGMGEATSLAGRGVEAAGKGAAVMGLTTPTEEGRTSSAIEGAILGPIAEAVGPTLSAGQNLIKSLKVPNYFGQIPGLQEIGSAIKNTIGDVVNKDYAQRAMMSERNYNAALSEARTKQQVNPFATSQEGQALLQSLEKDKYVKLPGGQIFLKGEEQRTGIDRLIKSIRGETTGGEEIPLGKGEITSKLTKKTPEVTREKDVSAIIEELRFLRSKDTTGKAAEDYAGLSKEYRDNLINKLEQSLYTWNPKYQAADQAYKAASEKMNIYKTGLMSQALKGEKFDFKTIAADPEEFAHKFFQTADTVKQLKEVTKNPQQVNALAKDYVATMMQNKSPKEILKYAIDPRNEGWLKEAGLYNDLKDYANKATIAESRTNLLKKIGYTAGGIAVGEAALNKARNMLGL